MRWSFILDLVSCVYSCGQFGEDYQEYRCSNGDKAMECQITYMKVSATRSGKHQDSLDDYRPNFYCDPIEEMTGSCELICF